MWRSLYTMWYAQNDCAFWIQSSNLVGDETFTNDTAYRRSMGSFGQINVPWTKKPWIYGDEDYSVANFPNDKM
jgi:hypothetical protein